jgi:hypothetical protein
VLIAPKQDARPPPGSKRSTPSEFHRSDASQTDAKRGTCTPSIWEGEVGPPRARDGKGTAARARRVGRGKWLSATLGARRLLGRESSAVKVLVSWSGEKSRAVAAVLPSRRGQP